jgi:gluconate 2-dehydrogenase gamma chain
VRTDDLSRRSLLQALAATIGAAALPFGWTEIARAAHEAHVHGQLAGEPKTSFFSASDAADVAAVTAQIIPSDDTPGAREAGVVYFIDRALALPAGR